MLERAIILATKAHEHQIDKVGEPYILHPLRVMMAVQGMVCRTVAVLHDVIEDSDVTGGRLREEFPDEIVNSVVALSKTKGEHLDDYLKRVCADPVARIVKIADVKDNSSPVRLYRLDRDTIVRLTKKYSYALKILEGW